jgi:hypothetical protein
MTLNTLAIPFSIHAESEDWYEEGGLADSIFWTLTINAIISPLVYIISPSHILKLFKRWRLVKENIKFGAVGLSQDEANKLFEGPQIDLANRNAHLVKTYMVTMFYAPMLPVGILISAVALGLDYWATKYMLLRVHARPKKHGVGIYDSLLDWISRGIFIHAVRII